MTNVLFTPANLYKDIHKGLRGELFAVTSLVGSLDPADECGRRSAGERITTLGEILTSHAEHEYHWVGPHVEAHLPELAERVFAEHAAYDTYFADIAKAARAAETRLELHEIYLDLASFTGGYLEHLDVEENQILEPLVAALGVEFTIDLHMGLVGSLTPAEMAMTLPLMFTAMNVDDRTALLGGMQANAPAEVFAGVWALCESVIPAAESAKVAARLGIA